MLYNNDTVVGIKTNDMGISKDGSKKETFQPGVALKGSLLVTFLISTSIWKPSIRKLFCTQSHIHLLELHLFQNIHFHYKASVEIPLICQSNIKLAE